MAKTIGILGGMSPESTVDYYIHLIHTYIEKRGNYDYPEILIYSVSFGKFVRWMHAGNWDKIAEELSIAANKLADAGADFVIIATNTKHIVYKEISEKVKVPILSILDCVARKIVEKDLKKVLLLGTKFTMESDLYPSAMSQHGIDVLVPTPDEIEYVNKVIFEELVAGVIKDESRKRYAAIIEKMSNQGAEGVILGCTEIPLLITENDTDLHLFDTAKIHAEAALNFALE